ncbi:M3 family oligoendopeptidase [Paenibacillus sp. GCM10027629]|uniref:M3 family oligoendopeptidase n=1 Tax=Paenibacillus sp. GCM10027629 TaxID=3273414 RepID=UPI0036434AAC
MQQPLQQTWDLESIFAGGSSSDSFAQFLIQIESDIKGLQQQLTSAAGSTDVNSFRASLQSLQDITLRVREAASFASCLTAENQKDKKATMLVGRVTTINAQLLSVMTVFDEQIRSLDDGVWSEWLKQPEIAEVAFNLNERREWAKEKLSPELEALAGDLAVSGYHAWGELYNTIVGSVQIPWQEGDKTTHLSAGQAYNKLSDGSSEVRAEMFKKWEEAWGEKADFCGDALNHLAGFRLKLYEKRGWDSILKEPLAINRMSEETLNVMWDVIIKNKPIFIEYLNRKAKLLGTERLSWVDVEAPVGASSQVISYDEGAQIIEEQFRKFSPKLADFTVQAFEKRWIEAEDRAGKRPGGFCTSLPVSKETRIFMTYAGTPSNVSTLAHELGHAYHQYVTDGLPAMAQEYAMNVAETASTFAELIVSDSVVKMAKSDDEKLALLENKIQNSIAFFMNIHARFLFETRFYAKRKEGLVGVEELNELMVAAQKEAFCDALSEYHPHFWASKLHFYITDVPFYNFPYTFGYLFSAGIYAQAMQEGAAFEQRYIDLLRDTARMTVEELAQKHLGVDLTKPEFWQKAVDLSIADVREFMAMTE